MVSTNRIQGAPPSGASHKSLTAAELKHGLSHISESGYQDGHMLKGPLPAKVKAGFEKLEPRQTASAEFYQLNVKGHGIFVSVQYGTNDNTVHVFDPAGKPLLSGTFRTDGEPVSWGKVKTDSKPVGWK
jgi:hypothetical protein